MQTNSKPLTRLFERPIGHDDAALLVAEAARACYVVASIQALSSFVFGSWGLGLGQAIMSGGLGFWLQRRQSRVAAFLLLALGVSGLIGGLMNRHWGVWLGLCLFFSGILTFVGYRACQATYKLAPPKGGGLAMS